MNSPNPVPTSPTPLQSQWDSAIVRQLAYALLGLVATILADIFNLSTSAFLEKGGRVIDALLGFAVIAVPLVLAWRARRNNPTPPIAGTAAVEKTVEREQNIASATTYADKVDAIKMKCAAWTVLGAAVLAALALQGCAVSPSKPLQVAQTIPQKGYAAAGLYEILQSRGLDAMRFAQTPDAVKVAIADADKAATPVILQLTKALRLYQTIEGITSADRGNRLDLALKSIDSLVRQAEPLLRALEVALGKAPQIASSRALPDLYPLALAPIPRGAPALAWSDGR